MEGSQVNVASHENVASGAGKLFPEGAALVNRIPTRSKFQQGFVQCSAVDGKQFSQVQIVTGERFQGAPATKGPWQF